MRSEATIRRKVRQVIYRYLQQEYRRLDPDGFNPKPQTCLFNTRLPLAPGQEVWICGCPEERAPRGVVCDGRIQSGLDWAKSCPWWKPLRAKADIKKEFEAHVRQLMEATDRGPLASEYPDLAALVWALDLPQSNEPGEQGTPEDNPLGWMWNNEDP